MHSSTTGKSASIQSGLIILNKPQGITSRQAIDRVKRLAQPAKVGHAGTLDPLASGVLVVTVGAATRLTQYIQQMPKQYVGTFLLGRSSPTEDVDGQVTELDSPPIPTPDQIEASADRLTGRILQRPPDFSALKIAGRRAYDLARQGKPVDLKPRWIEVDRLEVVEYSYPELTLQIGCRSGTYVRSLGRDLAESLDTAAVMSALIRTAIGSFSISQAVDPESLTAENWFDSLLPPQCAVAQLTQIELNAEEIARIRKGQSIPHTSETTDLEFAALDSSGNLVAILIPRTPGQLGPKRVFPTI